MDDIHPSFLLILASNALHLVAVRDEHINADTGACDLVVVFIDPFMGEGYDVPADAAISSHDHPDHCAFNPNTGYQPRHLHAQRHSA